MVVAQPRSIQTRSGCDVWVNEHGSDYCEDASNLASQHTAHRTKVFRPLAVRWVGSWRPWIA
jgi:hypothetical protein